MPPGFEEIPEGLKDPEGRWFTMHQGTLGFFVNVDALGDAPIPTSWEDLPDPAYAGMVGYLDPSSAIVGYAGAVAVNRARGGTLDDFTTAIEYLHALAGNDPIVPRQTSYARVVSGEIPILLDDDFDADRASYTEDGTFEFVIPEEGTVVVPYVQSRVADAPSEENGRRILDFILSARGPTPICAPRAIVLPVEIAARFLRTRIKRVPSPWITPA